MSPRVLILNGPNLNRLGTREPDVYGRTTFADLTALVLGWAADLGLDASVRQTNSESELIEWLHAVSYTHLTLPTSDLV